MKKEEKCYVSTVRKYANSVHYLTYSLGLPTKKTVIACYVYQRQFG